MSMTVHHLPSVYESIKGRIQNWQNARSISFSDYTEFTVCMDAIKAQVAGERHPFELTSLMESLFFKSSATPIVPVYPKTSVDIVYSGVCQSCKGHGQCEGNEAASVDDDQHARRTVETGAVVVCGCKECGGDGSYRATRHWLWGGVKKEGKGFRRGRGKVTITTTITSQGEIKLRCG